MEYRTSYCVQWLYHKNVFYWSSHWHLCKSFSNLWIWLPWISILHLCMALTATESYLLSEYLKTKTAIRFDLRFFETFAKNTNGMISAQNMLPIWRPIYIFFPFAYARLTWCLRDSAGKTQIVNEWYNYTVVNAPWIQQTNRIDCCGSQPDLPSTGNHSVYTI